MAKKILFGILIAAFAFVVAFLCYHAYGIVSAMNKLDDVPAEYSYGPDDADLTVVEFVKYTCPYCRELHPIILNAVEQDGKVRYVPRPLPSDVEDVHFAYAAGKQGLFKLAHGALLNDPRIMDEGGLMEIAETLALDVEKLQADMKSEDVLRQINENIELFWQMGASRTPTFIIGHDIIYVPEGRMPTVEDFLKMFEEARQ